MIKKIAATFKRYFHRAVALIVAAVLRPGAVYDPENFRLWESRGYHITPLHFYSPIPDTRDLKEMDFQQSGCIGIDFRTNDQLKLLKESFTTFSQEYNAFPIKPTAPQAFYLDNDSFGGIDPYIYYCMIRHYKPKTIVEVGSGNSTVLGAQTSQLNDATRYVCIDPWPRDFISKGVTGVDFIRNKVEDVDLDLFLQLQQNDILFVDGSHVVRTAGDVCFIILEVLPRLAKGVIIHIHDIFLPYDYPKEWLIRKHRFWTEQYLLQAYLTENCHIEILFANHFIAQKYTEEVRQAFPYSQWTDGGSFWIRKC